MGGSWGTASITRAEQIRIADKDFSIIFTAIISTPLTAMVTKTAAQCNALTWNNTRCGPNAVRSVTCATYQNTRTAIE
eukprot:5293740-Pyramimonas_sp.AAC.1